MTEEALQLVETSGPPDGGNVRKLLGFFGVPTRPLTIDEFFRISVAGDNSRKFGIICDSRIFWRFLDLLLERAADEAKIWQHNVHSVFVYAGADCETFEALARRITGDETAKLVGTESGTEWIFSNSHPDFCRTMSGVRISPRANGESHVLSIDGTASGTHSLISNPAGAALIQSEHQGIPVFLSTATTIIDVDARLAGRKFDVRDHFFSCVAIVLYVRWAFVNVVWHLPETNACLVIDDPLLTPRYGFLKFRALLGLMQRHGFATSIAFIPWNWRRSTSKVVRLFKESQGKYSLSIHGCDHTGGEFGGQNRERLAWKSKEATERMARHASRTGIQHDPVMVFPQGVFSELAMTILKRGDFIGVVNSEVLSTDASPIAIKISDVWDVAVMTYANFPIFTRRYPTDGVENFAFDILLGKPCLVVIHHDDCHHSCRQLVAFIDRLNALNAHLVWRNLGEVVRRSFRQTDAATGEAGVEMYGAELRLTNSTARRKTFRIRHNESDPTAIKEICLDSRPLAWTFKTDHVAFEVDLAPGQSSLIRLAFFPLPESHFKGETAQNRGRALVRRLLSEIRDNYVSRKPFSS